MVDTFGQFILPGEDIRYVEISAGGLGLEEGYLLYELQGDLFIPIRFEILQQLVGCIMAQEETSENPFLCGQFHRGMTKTIKAIDEIADEFAVAGAHLGVYAKETFQPGVEGYLTLVVTYYLDGVTKLVVKFHYISSKAFTGSLPNSSWSGFSNNSFIRTRKLTDSRPSMMR